MGIKKYTAYTPSRRDITAAEAEENTESSISRDAKTALLQQLSASSTILTEQQTSL